MTQQDLINLISGILIPVSFKRKGKNWVLNGQELTKIVNLQKSNFGNYYYLNYGFVIKKVELTTRTHVEQRLGSTDRAEFEKINNLLNLDYEMNDFYRSDILKQVINVRIVDLFDKINSDQDILGFLKERETLNDIPLIVKEYFNLPLPT